MLWGTRQLIQNVRPVVEGHRLFLGDILVSQIEQLACRFRRGKRSFHFDILAQATIAPFIAQSLS